MALKIHLVRHAQGLHNLCTENTILPDPSLTPKGRQQCTELQKNFPHHRDVDLIVSSPIRRTLYTSLLSFHDDIKTKGLRIIALPELQETTALPCDTGSAPEELANEFAGEPIDFTLVQPGWNDKTAAKWVPEEAAVAKRAQEAREWLYQRPENEIVVVTHGGLLHFITDDWVEKHKFPLAGWGNTEFRSYTFDTSRPGAHLIETEESKHRRDPKPLDHTEITQLKRTVTIKEADRAGRTATTSQTTHADGSAQDDKEATGSHGSRSKV